MLATASRAIWFDASCLLTSGGAPSTSLPAVILDYGNPPLVPFPVPGLPWALIHDLSQQKWLQAVWPSPPASLAVLRSREGLSLPGSTRIRELCRVRLCDILTAPLLPRTLLVQLDAALLTASAPAGASAIELTRSAVAGGASGR